jgi:fluoride exporter
MMASLAAVGAICVGASLGALARWQLGLWLNPSNGLPYSFPSNLPLGTLAANIIGGYLIGVCMGVLQAMPDIDPLWRLMLMTGFLGALTTFSTFSAEVVTMTMAHQYSLALATGFVHLMGSLLATMAGLMTAKWALSAWAVA